MFRCRTVSLAFQSFSGLSCEMVESCSFSSCELLLHADSVLSVTEHAVLVDVGP